MSIYYCKNCNIKEESVPNQRGKYNPWTLSSIGPDSYKFLCDCPYCNYHYAVFFIMAKLTDPHIDEYIEWYVNDYIPSILK